MDIEISQKKTGKLDGRYLCEEVRKIREKGGVWFGRAVDDGSDQRSGTIEFESEMLK